MDAEQRSESRRYEESMRKELERFTKYSPFCTIWIFWVAQIALLVQTGMDFLDTFEVSARFKNVEQSYAMEIIGATSLPCMAITYIGSMFAQAFTAHIPRLLGEGRRDVAKQVVADITRLCLFLSIVFPICFFSAIKPLLKFVACPPEIVDKAYRYCLPVLIGSPLLALFNLVIGVLLGIGKNWWVFGARCIPYIVQACVFTPILLWGLNISTDYCKWSQVVSEAIAGIFVFALMFTGKLDFRVPFQMFVKKPIKESFQTVLLAMPTLLQFFCFAFPPTIVMKCMSEIEPDRRTDIEACFGFWSKLTFFLAMIHVTFGNVFLITGGHAYGMGNYKRFFTLLGWGLVFGWTLVIILSVLIAIQPRWFAYLTLNGSQLDYACKMLPIPFYTFWLQSIAVFSTMILTAINRPIWPVLFSVLQIIVLCLGCKLLQDKVGGQSHKIMFIYVINDLIQFVAYGLTAAIYLCLIRRRQRSAGYEPINSTETNTE